MSGVAHALGTGLVLGLANAAHCAGMCGVFALGAARQRGLVPFFLGKLSTYIFLGALIGSLGSSIVQVSQQAQLWLGVAVGLVLVLAGVRVFRPVLALAGPGVAIGRWLQPAIAGLGSGALPGGGFALGAVTSFLPCGATWLALLQAATLGSPALAVLSMAGFALGTVPVLAAVGTLGPRLLARLGPFRLRAVGGVLIVGIGLFTLYRSLGALLLVTAPCCH